MGKALKIPPLAPRAYLEWENAQQGKHEYVSGEVFAMVGASRLHVTVALNVAAALKQALRGTPCQVFMSDMKLRVERADAFFYPDVMVSCDAGDRSDEYIVKSPALVVEVLSESTGAYDRGEKFARYRMLDSLTEYLLIDPDTRSVDLFRRDANGNWVLIDVGNSGEVELASVGVRLAIASIFEGVPPVSSR